MPYDSVVSVYGSKVMDTLSAQIVSNLNQSAAYYDSMGDTAMARYSRGYAKYVEEKALQDATPKMTRKALKRIKREERLKQKYENDWQYKN